MPVMDRDVPQAAAAAAAHELCNLSFQEGFDDMDASDCGTLEDVVFRVEYLGFDDMSNLNVDMDLGDDCHEDEDAYHEIMSFGTLPNQVAATSTRGDASTSYTCPMSQHGCNETVRSKGTTMVSNVTMEGSTWPKRQSTRIEA